jgi:putative glutamine amidotransferase
MTLQDKKRRVGISLRIDHIEKYDEKRDAISQDWIRLLKKIDALPVLIPNMLDDVKIFLEEMQVDCIILSGGDNIGDYPERDQTEKKIIDFSIEKKLPIFGVCRGMQILNNYFGGSIKVNTTSSHVGKPHTIQIVDKKIGELLDTNSFEVNSYHNNIINPTMLGEGLLPFALVNQDNTVEGYFHKKLPIIGVMWHPERDKNFKYESVLLDIFQNKLLWSK